MRLGESFIGCRPELSVSANSKIKSRGHNYINSGIPLSIAIEKSNMCTFYLEVFECDEMIQLCMKCLAI